MRTPKILAGLLLLIGLATIAVPAAAEPATTRQSDVYTFEGLPDLVDVGDATLARTDNGISFTLQTSGLEPGPHTVW